MSSICPSATSDVFINSTEAFAADGAWIAAQRPPESFRVAAIMTCFNEADILDDSLSELASQGVESYVIDNWSTDDSHAVARARVGKGVIGVERFPAEGPVVNWEWMRLLTRVAAVAQEIGADWSLHHDVDEVREPPWPELTLRQALYGVGLLGFNAIDHTVLDFLPVDNSFRRGLSLRRHFRHCVFGTRPGHFLQIKGWERQPSPVDLASSGGHDATFDGRRVFPYNFLLRHYPVRSQSHGERKIFAERVGRRNDAEYSRGWHTHYDHLSPGDSLLGRPEQLLTFDENFYEKYLLERVFRRYSREGR